MTQNTSDAQALLDLDALLDGTLDDLADVPSFKPFAAGTHIATLELSPKAIAGKPAVEWKLTHVETLELANPEDVPPNVGDTCSGAFIFIGKDGTKNEIAEGQFKEMMAPLAANFGTSSNRDTMAAAQGCTVAVTMSQREGKKGTNSEGKFFATIESLVVT